MSTKIADKINDFINTLGQFTKRYLLVGHRSKGQYKSKPVLEAAIDHFIYSHSLNPATTAIIYGGDGNNPLKPDVGYAASLFHDRGFAVMAAQNDVVQSWGGVPSFVSVVHYLKTQLDDAGKAIWGGVRNGAPIGPTSVYLSSEVRALLNGVVAFGGGPIGLQEVSFAQTADIAVIYYPQETAHPEINGPYGNIHDWALAENGGVLPSTLLSGAIEFLSPVHILRADPLVSAAAALLDAADMKADAIIKNNYNDVISADRFFGVPFAPQGPKKTVRFLRPDAWGECYAKELFYLSMRVHDRSEALDIIEIIMRDTGLDKTQLWSYVIEAGHEKAIEDARRLPSNEGSMELVIRLEPRNDKRIQHAKTLFTVMTKNYGLDPIAAENAEDQHYDLSTKQGQRDWGYHSFYKWGLALKDEDAAALRILATASYKDINSHLRSDKPANSLYLVGTGSSFRDGLHNLIDCLDSAFSKGRTDRAVVAYRADSNPKLHELWENFSQGQLLEAELFEKGYTFTTLDHDIAMWWGNTQLHREFIILDISIPAGTQAAFIDAEGVIPDRGYLELALARNSRFKIIGAYQDAKGQKHLRVNAMPVLVDAAANNPNELSNSSSEDFLAIEPDQIEAEVAPDTESKVPAEEAPITPELMSPLDLVSPAGGSLLPWVTP